MSNDIKAIDVKDVAGLSAPLTKLVEVCSQGLGKLTSAHFIRKTADARAYELQVMSQAIAESKKLLSSVDYEDGKIKIISSSSIKNDSLSLPDRVENRLQYQESRKQHNIESVISNAAQELAEINEVPEEKPSSDWFSRYISIVENISEEELQFWWGKILAGEIKKPRSFSIRVRPRLDLVIG